jgi:D-threo-aldose 1-dehydrogenase
VSHADLVPLGKTGLTLTRLGLGASVIGGLFAPVDEAEGRAVVRAALEHGISYVDTAPLYGLGRSEQLVGDVLRTVARDDFVISTKVGRLLRADARRFESLPEGMWHVSSNLKPVFDFSRDGVRKSIEESLARLGLERLDLVYVHDPHTHLPQAIGEALPALHELRSQGLVGAIGVGMDDPGALARIVREAEIDCILLAGRYTLLDQQAVDELLPLCRRRGVGVVVGGVFNSGVLADLAPGAHFDYVPAEPEVLERARRLHDVCASHGIPLTAAALQFPLGHPAVCSVLTGVRSVDELEQNVRNFDLPIPAALWRELLDDGLLPAGMPVPLGAAA